MRAMAKLQDDQAFIKDWMSSLRLTEMAEKYDVSTGTLRRKADDLGLGRKNSFLPEIELSGGSWVANERGIMKWIKEEE